MFAAVKLEVVLPPHSSSDLVLNTLKAGEDTMARVKNSQYEALEQQEGTEYSVSHNLYNMERPSAIISLDPMLSRAQALLGPESNYTTYQGVYQSQAVATVSPPGQALLHSASPLLSQTAPSPSPGQENIQI